MKDFEPLKLWLRLLAIWGTIFACATLSGLLFGRWRLKLKKKAKKGCFSLVYTCAKAGGIFTKPFAMTADWLSDIVVLLEMYDYGAFRLMYLSIGTLLFHLVTSAFLTFFDQPKYSKTRIVMPILQLFNLRIIYEVWRSAKLGRATYNLNEIRLMEAIFEAIPQMSIQMYFLFQYGDGKFWEQPMIVGSVICSVLNAATTLNYYDHYGLTSPESWLSRFLLLLFRYSDIKLRMIALGAIAFTYSAKLTFAYFCFFSIVSYITTLWGRITTERRSLIQDLQITLLTCFGHDFYDDKLTRFFNIWKILEKIILVVILAENFEYTIIKRVLLLMTILYITTIFTIQYYGIVDVQKYKNVRDRNKDDLFKDRNYEVLIRLLKRREIKLRSLMRYQLEELMEHGLQIDELIQAGFKDEKLLEMGFKLSELEEEAMHKCRMLSRRNALSTSSYSLQSFPLNITGGGKKAGPAQKHRRALSAFMDNEDIEGMTLQDLQKEGKFIGYIRCKQWWKQVSMEVLVKGYTLKALRKIRVSPKELLQVKDAEITLKQILDIKEYQTEPYEILELLLNGTSLAEIANSGYNVSDLLKGGLRKDDFVKANIKIEDWKKYGCTFDDLRKAGYKRKEIQAYYTNDIHNMKRSPTLDFFSSSDEIYGGAGIGPEKDPWTYVIQNKNTIVCSPRAPPRVGKVLSIDILDDFSHKQEEALRQDEATSVVKLLDDGGAP